MSYADAAYAVLESARRPLHYRDLSRLAIERKLIEPQGKTPEATMNAIIAVDIKRKGTRSRFIRIGRGVFGLRSLATEVLDTEPTGIADQESDRRVRIPLFPLYSEVRSILPVWSGLKRSRLMSLRTTLQSLWGNPKNPVD